MLDSSEILKQLDDIISEIPCSPTGELPNLESSHIGVQLITRASAAIERLSPPNSPYRKALDALQSKRQLFRVEMRKLLGILLAMQQDYADGYVQSFEELVHADIWDDLLEMASYFVAENYTDAGAVTCGNALESHLRRLCQKHDIELEDDKDRPKKASVLNDQLHKAAAYPKIQHRNVQSWLTIRNESAHMGENRGTASDIQRMIDGVSEFIARFPA